MKWNNRISNGQNRYVDYLNKLSDEQINKVLVEIDDENNQYLHTDGYIILCMVTMGDVEVICESSDDTDFLKYTCSAILRDRKITGVLA
jgi:hypothetical protein